MTKPTIKNQSEQKAHERVLVIGTSSSIQPLCLLLKQIEKPPIIAGCLIGVPPETVDKELPVPILGSFDDLLQVVSKNRIDLVLVSLSVSQRALTRRLTQQLDSESIQWRIMPTLADQLAGRLLPNLQKANQVNTGELINRQPRPLDEQAIRTTLTNRCVLVTGAGGSIGSELVRQVSRFAPSKLILVERSENALFEVDRQIKRSNPTLTTAAILHDVTDATGTANLVAAHQPDVIFHAAAHKHVPMMEDHPAQAVENNFFGTRSIADAADRANVKRFVMISTDKAVNPSSVMGATKRLAELYVQHINKKSDCTYSMVRFGNVLESTGSVIPIWTQQLASGGPMTITHPEMHRYFMTIPEAAGLVLQSAALSKGGEVFQLDMGQPVRIIDLAQRFLRSQGLEPDVDIPIHVTGPRPGEKLIEDLTYDGEDMIPTPHASVRIWQTTDVNPYRIEQIITMFDRLRAKGQDSEGHFWQYAKSASIVAALHAVIPEMVAAAAAG